MAGNDSDTVGIGIVESDAKARLFMSAVVGGTPGLRVVSAAPDGRDALWGFAQERHPRVLLVNLFLRDITGMEVVHRAKTLWPSMLPILLIPDDRLYLVIEALGSEARGYLPSPCPADEMVRAIWAVHRGRAIVSSSMSDAIVDHFRVRGSVLGRLTERERQVLRCLSRGLPQADIALELGVDKETVRSHVQNILSKLEVHSSVAAVAFYLNPRLSSAAKERHSPVEPRPPVPIPGSPVSFMWTQVQKSGGPLSIAAPSPSEAG